MLSASRFAAVLMSLAEPNMKSSLEARMIHATERSYYVRLSTIFRYEQSAKSDGRTLYPFSTADVVMGDQLSTVRD